MKAQFYTLPKWNVLPDSSLMELSVLCKIEELLIDFYLYRILSNHLFLLRLINFEILNYSQLGFKSSQMSIIM